MDRKAAGSLLITGALLGALLLSAFVRVGTVGVPVRSALPMPPVAGSCVIRTGTGLQIVGCERAHTAEVALAWNVESAGSMPTDLFQACQTATASYLGSSVRGGLPAQTSNRWGPPPVPYVVQLAHGPGALSIPGWSWQACMVQPVVPRIFQTGYTGRLKDLPTSTRTPPNLRLCYQLTSSVRSGTSCGDMHIGETLASQELRVEGDQPGHRDTDPTRTAQCSVIAQSATGAADPTFGGRLSVVVDLESIGGGGQTTPSTTGAHASASTFSVMLASCSVQVTGSEMLYNSVVGVGAGPLPLR